jgi:hypothetical protein
MFHDILAAQFPQSDSFDLFADSYWTTVSVTTTWTSFTGYDSVALSGIYNEDLSNSLCFSPSYQVQ